MTAAAGWLRAMPEGEARPGTAVAPVPVDGRPAPSSAGDRPRPEIRLRLTLLGRVDAWSLTSQRVLPRTRKARALLAILALSGPQPVARSRLAHLLWSRRGNEQARGSLRQALHELHESLRPVGLPVIVASRTTVAMDLAAVWTDAREVLRATPEQPEPLDLLGAGELLADLDGLDDAFDQWLAEQRRRLRDAALLVATARLAAALDPEASVAAARRVLSIDAAQEGAWRALIRAEAARGDRAAALAAYADCRQILATRFQARPSAETEALAQALREDAGVAQVAPSAPPPAGAAAPTARGAPPAALRGARLGVLPLRVLGGTEEAESEALSIGLAEEITAALARFRWLFLTDSASLAAAAARSGGPREAQAAARALGLDLLLTGTLQRAGRRIRIGLTLLDLRPPEGVAWTQRFDREADDLLALQDEIAAQVVARIDPEILLIEAGRVAAGRPPVNVPAYNLVLRAIPALHRLDRSAFMAAGEWLARATSLDPDYAAAHAWLAYWHLLLIGQGWARDGEEVLARTERLAVRAVALDPQDAQALTICGHVRAFLHQRPEDALALHERALGLNPNLAMAWAFSAMAHSYAGDHAEALARMDRYRQLAPFHPFSFYYDGARVIPLLFTRRHAEAAEHGRQAIELQPNFSANYKCTLAALGHLGRREAAAALRARLLAIEPDFTVAKALRRAPVRRPEDRAHYAEGLRLAGVREG
ncbi:hypothetical protein GCM10010964_02510 [Caldovatus sediminis]|uniref:Bacterial transcriptional activator domain-containing protein n=1 Tax=Caldovatus sediminis TaxID=2041189 RepID=A0A8J2Z7H0_9PROT|nr:BTAD domain-containing putative transcriptional regulator [Caldovatus sediminis]GGG17807.1 hypothetical protein GCM10010964_02510 [Caldovatus sediminis]